LIGKLFINAGDRILVEAPTYLGALQAFNIYGAEYESVPVDEDGLRTDLLVEPLRSGPKFMYVLPTSRTRPEPPCPKCVAMNWCCWRTALAFQSSRMIPTASCAMKASTSRRSSCSIARTCAATVAIPSATLSTSALFQKRWPPAFAWDGSSLLPRSSAS